MLLCLRPCWRQRSVAPLLLFTLAGWSNRFHCVPSHFASSNTKSLGTRAQAPRRLCHNHAESSRSVCRAQSGSRWNSPRWQQLRSKRRPSLGHEYGSCCTSSRHERLLWPDSVTLSAMAPASVANTFRVFHFLKYATKRVSWRNGAQKFSWFPRIRLDLMTEFRMFAFIAPGVYATFALCASG